jgi:hemerythrin
MFYDLNKQERLEIVRKINEKILHEINAGKTKFILQHFSNEDTYIRKTAYLAIGKIYKAHKDLHSSILILLNNLFTSENEKVRQTAINAAGEIGIIDFPTIDHLMELGLFDKHHSVRNAVIGSIKKMS